MTAGPEEEIALLMRRWEQVKAGDGAVVLIGGEPGNREIAPRDLKAETLSNDPLAIYKPTGAKHVDAAKAMGNFTGWTFAAVNAIASEVANIQLRLYKINGDDQEEVGEDHQLLTLLDGVNELMTGPELKYVTMAHLELTGNFFWLLDGVTNDTDKPRAIYPLNPGRVRVKLNKSTFPYKLDQDEFTLDGKVFHFQPYQILHGKYPDPNDPFVGIGG
jgi:phage portal protein BeeE